MRRLAIVALGGLLLVAGCAGPDGQMDGGVPRRACETTFRYVPPMHPSFVGVAGEWNNFDPSADPMQPDSQGVWTASVKLPPGDYGYKLVVGTAPNQTWMLDPQTGLEKYVSGEENSLVEVGDCDQPQLTFVKLDKTAAGDYHLEAQYTDGAQGAGPGDVTATVDGNAAPVELDRVKGTIVVEGSGLAKDKHRIVVSAKDAMGRAADDLLVPFWIEDQPFDFRDGIMYFAFTDRFLDGDPSNDMSVANVDPRANYEGGDFAGITQRITDGYFDSLGVRTIWISPPYKNPEHGEPGSDGRQYTGYHGYWPIAGRDPEERFGDLDALRTLVKTAHAHGIRVLVDGVLNHVHLEHPYYLMHKSDGWFNGDGSCVCGGPNCDWDTHRLDCWFASYLPDLNYETFPALQAMIDDTLFWAKDLDVDGFRVDAVKHFPHAVGRRLRAKLQSELEHGGTVSYYLVGETFTGGSDGERQFIASYLGDQELTAQFDFPLYWNMLGAFAQYSEKMSDLDAAALSGDNLYGGAPMSPFFGNHDVPRFITTASGMLVGDGKDQAWTAPPPSPPDDVPYQKLRLALAFLYTQPGVPLLYYGDEIGMPGAGDPDNRRMMKWTGLSTSEQATLDVAKKLGAARRELSALQRGARYTLWVDDDLYVYARVSGTSVAVVAINRSSQPRAQAVPVRPEVPLADGATLTDRLGGASTTPAGGMLPIDLPPMSAAVYAP